MLEPVLKLCTPALRIENYGNDNAETFSCEDKSLEVLVGRTGTKCANVVFICRKTVYGGAGYLYS